MGLKSSLFHYILALVACFKSPNMCLNSYERPERPLFVFGDSIFDAGNNNYINTTTDYQANMWPYGESFFSYATGRFSDGRTIPDFIAEYAGLPLIPPSLSNPGKYNILNGVNFASGGAGCLVETNRGFAVDLHQQVKYFKLIIQELKQKVGRRGTRKLIRNAVYMISVGTNDYIAPLSTSSTFNPFSQEYRQMIMGNITSILKDIYAVGGRKFALITPLPVGCLPLIRPYTLNGTCNNEMTNTVKMHNSALSQALKQLENELHGFKYIIFDYFKVLSERIDNPTKYGFKDPKAACCGSGPFRGISSCGGKRQLKTFELCKYPNDYLFFDSVHSTQHANQQCAELMWNGTSDVVAPLNFQTLLKLHAHDM